MSGMGLQKRSAPDIAPQHIEALMPRGLRDQQRIGAGLGPGGNEAGPQRMPRKPLRIEPHGLGGRLDNPGHRAVRQRPADPAMPVHGPEQKTGRHSGRLAPGREMLQRPDGGAVQNPDRLTGPVRVGLAASECEQRAVLLGYEIRNLQRHQFRPSQGSGKAQGQQRPVAPTDQRLRLDVEHPAQQVHGRGGFAGRRRAKRPPHAPQCVLDDAGAAEALEPGQFMHAGQSGHAPGQCRGFAALLQTRCDPGGDGFGLSGERRDALGVAPRDKGGPVGAIGAQRGRRAGGQDQTVRSPLKSRRDRLGETRL